MQQGSSPNQIISWLIANDVQNNPQSRQYGIVDYHNGSARSAAFTGSNCYDYKNHILGPNYAIQGNILLGQEILDSMEYYFLNTEGCLPDKLIASMLGARVVGADTRCMNEGTSSLSAFMRMALPTDIYNDLFLDINVAGTAPNIEPIDILENKYNLWKTNHPTYCQSVSFDDVVFDKYINVHPNPTADIITVNSSSQITIIEVFDILGNKIMTSNSKTINLIPYTNGIYILKIAFGDVLEEIKVIKK